MAMKKGFIYLSVVVILLIIMMTVFYVYQFYQPGQKDDAIETRIKTVNFFVEDFIEDSERAGYISGFRTFIALEEYISEKGTYLNDTEEIFKEVFLNGSYGDFTSGIINESTFSQYLERVKIKARELGISMNVDIISIKLSHSDPWNVQVDVSTNIVLTDVKGLASWNFSEVIVVNVPIENLKDPIYTVGTLGRFESFIVEGNITDFVGPNNNTDNLKEHIENFYYKAAPEKAPSFLMRYEGNFSNSTYGIESIVDISFLEKQEDITIYTSRSVVDYIYFSGMLTTNYCNFQNMPSWFKIDDLHLTDYELTGLSYSSC
ncbi:MAG: hypothetical protein ABIB43_03650 [archaeon]